MPRSRTYEMWCNCCGHVVQSDCQENEDGVLVCPECGAEDELEEYEGQDTEGVDIYEMFDDTSAY